MVSPWAWPHFSFLRTGSGNSAHGLAAFFIFADKGWRLCLWLGRIFHFCGQGVGNPLLAWPHFLFLRTKGGGSAFGLAAFFVFADKGWRLCLWLGRIFRFCGQGMQVLTMAWPHFSFLRTGNAGSALGMSAFFSGVEEMIFIHPL